MQHVSSTIEKVTVYRSGATVHRRLDLNPAKGDTFSVTGLPLALTDASVKVSVVSAEGDTDALVVTGVHVGLFVAPKRDLIEPPDDQEITELERAIAKLEAELDSLDVEGHVLEELRVPERPEPEEGKPPPPSPMAARVLLEEMVDEGARRRRERSRAIRDDLDRLTKKFNELRARRDEASNAHRISAKEITKSVVARLAGADGVTSAVLRVDYFVPGARWAPAYQVRLAKDASSAQIVQRALICQRTGEDWRGVRLALSTAAPMRWTSLPELSAIRIGKRQVPPPSKRGFRPPPAGAGQLYADYDVARGEAAALVPVPPRMVTPSIEIEPPPDLSVRSMPPEATMIGSAMDVMMSASAGGGGPADAEDFEAFGEAREASFEVDKAVMAPPPAPSRPALRSAPAPMAKKRRKGRSRGEPEAQFGGAPAEVLEAVVYTQLVLGPASEPSRRGRLEPIGTRNRYLETIDLGGRRLTLDVMAMVLEANAAATRALDASLPAGAIDVASVSGAFDYTYAADAAVDVASDGVFHSVPLGTRKSACDVKYVVVPREDTNVFRIARIENPLYAPLLAGPAELYVGGEYVLTTRLATVAPKGALTLGLGVEQAIRCARNTKFTEKRTSDTVVATNELCHDIRIELVNNLPRAASCEVRERIPQPAEDAEVVVDETDVTPPWDAYDQEERGAPVLGGRRWSVQVPAGETLSLSARYVLKIYANNEIAGGNRREV